MHNLRYKWKRFLHPRGGMLKLYDEGFLPDSDSEFGHIHNPDLVPLDSIAEIPCLVLLGEPGMGKSTFMGDCKENTDIYIDAQGQGALLWCDLATCPDRQALFNKVFESETFNDWRNGKHHLYLFLDSLDECMIHFKSLVKILGEEFKKCQADRLQLRIACRTTVWPVALESDLKECWGTDGVGVYELTPLRSIDVIESARQEGLDPDAFLREISRLEVGSLASKPSSLRFLLDLFRSTGRLSPHQKDIFFEGCRYLCQETEYRSDIGLTGDLSAGQRLVVAARIAAVALLSGRSTLVSGTGRGYVPGQELRIFDLSGGSETLDGLSFDVSEDAVKESIDTGLFRACGPRRLCFSHHTYAEFLAAWYLNQHEVPMKQVMNMLVHPDDPSGRLIPQLHGVAVWLASMRPDIFAEIMRKDPDVLLRSDVATAEAEIRKELVATLLDLYDKEVLVFNWSNYKYFGKLAHPGLACQLRSYICDGNRSKTSRSVAVMIAEQCNQKELQNDLLLIALKPLEPLELRYDAARAVSLIGDSSEKAQLKPLARGSADDLNDELKGYALQAIWPDYVSVNELLTRLTPPKRKNYHGSYYTFLSDNLIQHLQVKDLPYVLEWVEEQGPRHSLTYAFQNLVDDILALAWNHLEQPDTLSSFVKVCLLRLKHHEGILGNYGDHKLSKEEWVKNVDKRRMVLKAALPMLREFDVDPRRLTGIQTPLAMREDLQLMIDWLKQEDSEGIRSVLIDLIGRVFDSYDLNHLEAIYETSMAHSDLAKEFGWVLNAIQLDSPEAEQMKDAYHESLKCHRANNRSHRVESTPTERIAFLLDECESGNPALWWQLIMEMTLESESTHYGDYLGSDPMTFPGWRDSSDSTKDRIMKAAREYLIECCPEPEKWLGTDQSYRPALAGYQALRLLYQIDCPLYGIPIDAWRKWAPIVLASPFRNNASDEELQQNLAKNVYDHFPEEVIDILMVLIDRENARANWDYLLIVKTIRKCLDERLTVVLLQKAKDPLLKPGFMGDLISELLMHGCCEAKAYAVSLLALRTSAAEKDRSRAVVAASILMTTAEDADWDIVWPIMKMNREFGSEVLEYIYARSRNALERILPKLTEHQLADLFVWLERQYPRNKDPDQEGGYVGFRYSVGRFRDSILTCLETCGTPDACDAIWLILEAMPHLTWLKRILMIAEANVRCETWVPPEPSTVLRLIFNATYRFVQSERQLLDIVIESLGCLQVKLQGKTLEAIFLWDKVRGGKFRPKDEGTFCDYVKIHLDEELRGKGIVSNREVQIYRGTPSSPGEITDIHVDCARHNSHGEIIDTVTVIIEAKGCWNRDLMTAMKTQLAKRYLRNNPCRHGIYLVGWFLCEQWDCDDNRRKDAMKNGSDYDEIQKILDNQAAELSTGDLCIKAVVLDASLP
jgi:predicted NACHT family NTPase